MFYRTHLSDSLCYVLTGSQKEHLILRNEIAQHMRNRCNEQLKNYLSTDVNLYLDNAKMRNDNTLATDAEILGEASLLGCDIIVYAQYGSDFSWLRYPASFSLTNMTEYCLLIQNINSHFEPILELHVWEINYSCWTCFKSIVVNYFYRSEELHVVVVNYQ